MMRFVLNAVIAKKTAYGGFRVTCNFIYATFKDRSIEWYYIVSQDVAEAVFGDLTDGAFLNRVHVFPNQPDFSTYFRTRKEIKTVISIIKPDLVYSTVAPSYFTFDCPEVMQCANAWTVVGGINRFVLKVTPLFLMIRRFLMSRITRWQMRKCKFFITESQIAKTCILQTVRTDPDNVCVVSNVLPEVFQSIRFRKIQHETYNMVYASSPAYHKDFLILPQMASLLEKSFGVSNFIIHYTIPDNALVYPSFRKLLRRYGVEHHFVNHGILKPEELAKLYSQCDLGLFPSLLETFSVTLLEYMHFRLPIVASDLGFNKEVADDAAVYFKPHDAFDFADKVYQVYSSKEIRNSLLDNAVKRLTLFSNNADKYEEKVRFLKTVASR